MDVNCAQCNKEFKKYSNQKAKNHFCSRECYAKWRSENLKGKNNYHPKAKLRVDLECLNCGEKIERAAWRLNRSNNHFCSQECKKEYMIGEKAEGSWKGGSHRRPAHKIRSLAKYKRWRNRVLERDDYECQKCGADDHLDTHHIVSFNDLIMEYNITSIDEAKKCTELWNVDNGQTLCVRCHAEEHPEMEQIFKLRIA